MSALTGWERTANARAVMRDPSKRLHSTRQRTLVLTFETPAAAEAFDKLDARQVVELLADAVDEAETNTAAES